MRTAWILDISPVAQGMCLWMLDGEGRAFACVDRWAPHFYIKSVTGVSADLESFFRFFRTPVELQVVEKKDFFSGAWQPVIKASVQNPLLYSSIVKRLSERPSFTLFDADVPLTQMYFYERQTFPLARCQIEIDAEGFVVECHLDDSPWELIYKMPPLRYAHLALQCKRPHQFILTLGMEQGKGVSYAMEAGEEDLITSLNHHIRDWDPDIILTDGGDSTLIPRLQFHSERTGHPVQFSRSWRSWEPKNHVTHGKDHSFFSYGKIQYRAAPRTFFGRLHIDTKNSFSVGHTGIYGLFEIARVAKIPIQRAARCTIGTSLSSMQHEWAVRHDCLVPLDKGQTEDFRPALDLISSDRGGLVYEPEIGWHDHLIEFDFSSMYPEIMIRNNITPEAVNCSCCADNKAPGIEHHVCRKRGMVPDVLEPVVKKRGAYKKLIKAKHPDAPILRARYDAFKWALVCCFGYLGFRNARFGKIEAHECVNAYGREALLRAKEVAEDLGFHFVHAIVDSLWLKKDSADDQEIEQLRLKIEEATGLPIGLEGRYRWIKFCASKVNPEVGVPNRYFGVFTNGESKVRGIEMRRHDTPLLFKRLQEDLLRVMSTARDRQELENLRPELEKIVDDYRDRLKCGAVNPLELAIHKQLSQTPEAYLNDTLTAIAAKKMAGAGIKLNAGETIAYVVTEERDKVKDWRVTPLAFIEDSFEYDHRYYGRLLEQALDILPFHRLTSKPAGKKVLKRPSAQLEFCYE